MSSSTTFTASTIDSCPNQTGFSFDNYQRYSYVYLLLFIRNRALTGINNSSSNINATSTGTTIVGLVYKVTPLFKIYLFFITILFVSFTTKLSLLLCQQQRPFSQLQSLSLQLLKL